MNLAPTLLSSAVKSTANLRPQIIKPSTTLSILESNLQRCRTPSKLRQIHAQMTVSGLINDAFAASRLLSDTAAHPSIHLQYSVHLLRQIDSPNAFTWNTLMRAHVQRAAPHRCIPLYKSMLRSDSLPDNYTHPIAIQSCALRSSDTEGQQIHAHVLQFGFDSDVYAQNTLINMYSVCGNLQGARLVFDASPVLDSVSWNSILAAYVEVGDVEEAVAIFARMPKQNTIAANSMIALFGRCHRTDDARRLFDGMTDRDIVTWTATISCYEQNEMFGEALQMFVRMRREGIAIDEVVSVSVLSACARLGAVGESVHGLIAKVGLGDYMNVQNALINMYASGGSISTARRLFDLGYCLDQISWNSMMSGYLKCGLVGEAEELFRAMPQRDVVSWATMVSGYAQNDRYSETLVLFNEMQAGGVRPDETTLVSAISACAHLSALEQGKWIHAFIRKHGFSINTFLGTTLIDMYMKCGCVKSALEVFDDMKETSTSTWNTVITGLAMNGLIADSLQKFSEMEGCSIRPNEITYVGVLGACRHSGLIDKGRQFFESMQRVYGIVPNVKHYSCMVDLLGRAGLLREAEELIESMPMAPDEATWGALLGACKKHGNTELGERLGRKLVELEPRHDGFHVLLSNIYTSKGMWNHAMELRGAMRQRGILKTPGCSIIESKGVVHEFLAGDTTHPQIKEIDRMLDEIARRLKMEGFKPDTTDVSFDIEEEEKETVLSRHSEKLAIAFGLISISPPTPIRITKNLRICSDCHSAAKIISKAFDREIVVRDRHRFHHFRQGVCSCSDYW